MRYHTYIVYNLLETFLHRTLSRFLLIFTCTCRVLPARPKEAEILSNNIVYNKQTPYFACPDNSNPADCIANLTAAFIADGEFSLHNTASYTFHIINKVVRAFVPGDYSARNISAEEYVVNQGCATHTNKRADDCSGCLEQCESRDSSTDAVCTDDAPCSGTCVYKCPTARMNPLFRTHEGTLSSSSGKTNLATFDFALYSDRD